MKQRVALARALAPNPRVLLMDEPFAALDAMTREQLYGDLQEIWAARKKTIVFVTHNVREAVCLGDRVVLFLAASGAHPRGVQDRPAAAARHQQPEPGGLRHRDHPRAEGIIARQAEETRGMKTLRSSRFLFFAALAGHLASCWCSAAIWSPVLLPDPRERVALSRRGASKDGRSRVRHCWVTMKRLLLGYVVGVCIGLPLGLLTARFQVGGRHHRRARARLADPAQRLLGAARAALVWPDGGGHALRRHHGHALVGALSPRTTACATCRRSYARAAHTMGSRGLHTWLRVILPASLPFIVSGMKQGWAFAWRSLMAAEIYVTILTGFGLGICCTTVARTQRHGPGHRHHARHRGHRPARGQNPLLPVGAFSPPALGAEINRGAV